MTTAVWIGFPVLYFVVRWGEGCELDEGGHPYNFYNSKLLLGFSKGPARFDIAAHRGVFVDRC